jgi:hypothetical protein
MVNNMLDVQTNALTCAKLAQPGVASLLEGLDEFGLTVALDFVVAGYMDETVNTYYKKNVPYSTYEINEHGLQHARTVTYADLAGENSQSPFNALWMLLLLKGGEHRYYSGETIDPLGSQGQMLHLTSCGLDPLKSSIPTDDHWSYFGGTFVEDDEQSGISGHASCRCGDIEDYTVRMAHTGEIAKLVITLMSGLQGLLP